MKQKIIGIIGFGIEPESAEVRAIKIINLFNERIVEKAKENIETIREHKDWLKVFNNIIIHEK